MSETTSKNNVKIAHAATLSSFRTLADGTLKIELSLEELTPDKAAMIFQLHNQYVKFLISNENISIEEEIIMSSVQLNSSNSTHKKTGKSPSQRLRNKMFVFYELKYGVSSGFDDWYRSQIEVLENQFLTAINELNQ